MKTYSVTITNDTTKAVRKLNVKADTTDGAIDTALDAIGASDNDDIVWLVDAKLMPKVNRNGDTYERSVERFTLTFGEQSYNNPYPNVSWLLGSDWGCGIDISSMTPDEYRAYVFERLEDQYK